MKACGNLIAVNYYIVSGDGGPGEGASLIGTLLYREQETGPQALGGIDNTPQCERRLGARRTVIYTSAGERCLEGWAHPDHLAEISGADGPGLVVTELFEE